MKQLLPVIAALGAIVVASLAVGITLPPVNDGWDHGDPPFLLEPGWTPLFNGRNLAGREYTDPQKGAWGVTQQLDTAA